MTLNELNFNKLINLGIKNVNDYNFKQYKENGFTHPKAVGYCTSCEKANVNVKDCTIKGYHLCNISHGSHSKDFLYANKDSIDTTGWNNDGVMFILENPSIDYGIYDKQVDIDYGFDYKKHPASKWYWVHEQFENKKYPANFKSKEYGEFFSSAILTFKLSNAYVTNLVKCGMNNKEGKFKNILDYKDCIPNCYKEFLNEEIKLINPKVIFTFGSRTYDELVKVIEDKNIEIVSLPHPSRRSFENEYFNVLYFCMISKWLYKTGVITKNFYNDLMDEFAKAGHVDK